MLCFAQMEDCAGRVGIGEREFLISPSFGALVMTSAVRNTDSASDKKFSKTKPFDWMQEDQYSNLLLLATHYEVGGAFKLFCFHIDDWFESLRHFSFYTGTTAGVK